MSRALTPLYQEISEVELFQVCTQQLGDIEAICARLLSWLRVHPELIDTRL